MDAEKRAFAEHILLSLKSIQSTLDEMITIGHRAANYKSPIASARIREIPSQNSIASTDFIQDEEVVVGDYGEHALASLGGSTQDDIVQDNLSDADEELSRDVDISTLNSVLGNNSPILLQLQCSGIIEMVKVDPFISSSPEYHIPSSEPVVSLNVLTIGTSFCSINDVDYSHYGDMVATTGVKISFPEPGYIQGYNRNGFSDILKGETTVENSMFTVSLFDAASRISLRELTGVDVTEQNVLFMIFLLVRETNINSAVLINLIKVMEMLGLEFTEVVFAHKVRVNRVVECDYGFVAWSVDDLLKMRVCTNLVGKSTVKDTIYAEILIGYVLLSNRSLDVFRIVSSSKCRSIYTRTTSSLQPKRCEVLQVLQKRHHHFDARDYCLSGSWEIYTLFFWLVLDTFGNMWFVFKFSSAHNENMYSAIQVQWGVFTQGSIVVTVRRLSSELIKVYNVTEPNLLDSAELCIEKDISKGIHRQVCPMSFLYMNLNCTESKAPKRSVAAVLSPLNASSFNNLYSCLSQRDESAKLLTNHLCKGIYDVWHHLFNWKSGPLIPMFNIRNYEGLKHVLELISGFLNRELVDNILSDYCHSVRLSVRGVFTKVVYANVAVQRYTRLRRPPQDNCCNVSSVKGVSLYDMGLDISTLLPAFSVQQAVHVHQLYGRSLIWFTLIETLIQRLYKGPSFTHNQVLSRVHLLEDILESGKLYVQLIAVTVISGTCMVTSVVIMFCISVFPKVCECEVVVTPFHLPSLLQLLSNIWPWEASLTAGQTLQIMVKWHIKSWLVSPLCDVLRLLCYMVSLKQDVILRVSATLMDFVMPQTLQILGNVIGVAWMTSYQFKLSCTQFRYVMVWKLSLNQFGHIIIAWMDFRLHVPLFVALIRHHLSMEKYASCVPVLSPTAKGSSKAWQFDVDSKQSGALIFYNIEMVWMIAWTVVLFQYGWKLIFIVSGRQHDIQLVAVHQGLKRSGVRDTVGGFALGGEYHDYRRCEFTAGSSTLSEKGSYSDDDSDFIGSRLATSAPIFYFRTTTGTNMNFEQVCEIRNSAKYSAWNLLLNEGFNSAQHAGLICCLKTTRISGQATVIATRALFPSTELELKINFWESRYVVMSSSTDIGCVLYVMFYPKEGTCNPAMWELRLQRSRDLFFSRAPSILFPIVAIVEYLTCLPSLKFADRKESADSIDLVTKWLESGRVIMAGKLDDKITMLDCYCIPLFQGIGVDMPRCGGLLNGELPVTPKYAKA